MDSVRDKACKHVEFSVPTPTADSLRERLEEVRSQPKKEPTITPIDVAPGLLESLDSLLLPAAARQGYRAAFIGATLHVVVQRGPDPPPWPRLVAIDKADRQRRRKTWKQNVDRYALPPGSKVLVQVAGSPTLRRILGEPDTPSAVAVEALR